MRLVTSLLTIKELSDDDIAKATEIITREFNTKFEVFKFGLYDDCRFYNVDIDIFNIFFTKEKIYDDINKLISIYEEILKTVSIEIDIIAGNDDTEGAVQIYEKDNNDIKDFGLFITNRTIPNSQPYYSSEICNAYVNLTHVSFGVYY